MPVPSPCASRSALLLVTVAMTVAAARIARVPAGDSIAAAGLHTRYGAAVALGDGQARTYVVADGGPATRSRSASP